MAKDLKTVRAGAFQTIVFGALAIGILDFLDASIFFPSYYGISFAGFGVDSELVSEAKSEGALTAPL